MMGRECTDCHAFKAWSAFASQARGLNGKSSICKLCRRVRSKKWMATHTNRYLSYLALRKTFERKQPVCAECEAPGPLQPYTFDGHRALYHPLCAFKREDALGDIPNERKIYLQELSIS